MTVLSDMPTLSDIALRVICAGGVLLGVMVGGWFLSIALDRASSRLARLGLCGVGVLAGLGLGAAMAWAIGIG